MTDLVKRLHALSNNLAEMDEGIGEKFTLPNEAADELSRLTMLIAEQQRQIEEGEKLKVDRDSLRKALDDRHEADKRAWKAIMSAMGRKRGIPSNKEVVAYYVAENDRLGARIAELEKERDNARAEVSWLARLLMKTRNSFSYIVSDIEDDGDRAYFGSTNDADTLRDIRNQMKTWEECRIMRDGAWEDYITKCAEANAKLSALQSSARQMKEALERVRAIDMRKAGCNSEDSIEYDGPAGKIAAAALRFEAGE